MSVENETSKDERYVLCEFQVIAGVIPPKGQHIDTIIRNIFKVYCWEDFDFYMITAPKNNKVWPTPPSRKLFPQWYIGVSFKILEGLWIKKHGRSLKCVFMFGLFSCGQKQ